MITADKIKSLSFTTPVGNQQVFFDGDINFKSLLSSYDQVLLVIDGRVRDLERVSEVVSSIKDMHPVVSEVLIDINNLTKNTELMSRLLDTLACAGISRKSLLIAIGGGATGDLVGVTASMYMRGVDYAVIPTSFISMADGIISKVAINHGTTKNMVGAFYSPRWIAVDGEFIDPGDSLRITHGLVEVWKHAIIERNTSISDTIEQIAAGEIQDTSVLLELCRWSMQTKAKYVLQDWNDTEGMHKALSLGHTLANYLEMSDKLHHAEAVFYGIQLEAILALQKGILREASYKEFITMGRTFENQFKLLDRIKPLLNKSVLTASLQNDKISNFGKIRFVLPTESGYSVEVISLAELKTALDTFQSLNLS